MDAGGYLEAIAKAEGPRLDEILELMLGWAEQHFGTDALVEAREKYFQDMGKAFAEDAFYDARMSYFFDQFLFEGVAAETLKRQLEARGLTPAEGVAAKLAGLMGFRHSLFQIAKVSDQQIVLKDLLQPAKLVVSAEGDQLFRGFEKKAILQAFVYQLADVRHLSRGLVVHPARVTPLIKKQLKVAQKAGETQTRALLCKYASIHMRHLRHKHVDAKVIYQG